MGAGSPLTIDVAVIPEALPPELGGATVLIIDVLRASTTIITALAGGCAGIIPVSDPEEARRRAGACRPGRMLLAGERRGEKIAGFDLGNSPAEFRAAAIGDQTVILTTSNGTRAILAARRAARVGIAGFVNLSAAAAWAVAGDGDVTLLCAGQRGSVSLEDLACAGLLVERLSMRDPAARLTDAAAQAVRVGRRYEKDLVRLAEDAPWARHLAGLGYAADVALCLTLDTTTLVPVLSPDVDKVVAGVQ